MMQMKQHSASGAEIAKETRLLQIMVCLLKVVHRSCCAQFHVGTFFILLNPPTIITTQEGRKCSSTHG